MFELGLTLIIYLVFIAYWRRRQAAHEKRLPHYKVRVHVNGIRGKSTVTRLIAGVLREAGYRTLAKTTGSAAVTINFDGEEVPIPRRGAANVREQQDIIARWESQQAEALVIECMALQPKFQEWTENMVIRSHIGVITNVREDHQDVMGETLPEIAVSLAHMCPTGGYLVTAEYDPDLQVVLRREAEKRNSQLVVADPIRVRDDDIAQFDYLSFKDNVAIGLAVADLLGIDRDVAMRGMIKAKGDIGVVRLQRVTLRGKPVIWANLFAVNDRESMIISLDMLEAYCDDKTVRIGILNNRYDRERRAKQFGDVAAKDLKFDWLITFGAYEDLVTRKLLSNNFPRERIVNLGFSVSPTIEQIIDAIAGMIPEGWQAMLVGFVNIHTPQAEMLMEYFEHLKDTYAVTPTELEGDIGYLRRRRFEMAHVG
ncbi:MAG TPA: poly-gamma-glutamate synthase PgsB [Anaerolineae bacterium]|nr:poly-gamma-glutamate synthase PgsB [Anaerolineae bacterium]